MGVAPSKQGRTYPAPFPMPAYPVNYPPNPFKQPSFVPQSNDYPSSYVPYRQSYPAIPLYPQHAPHAPVIPYPQQHPQAPPFGASQYPAYSSSTSRRRDSYPSRRSGGTVFAPTFPVPIVEPQPQIPTRPSQPPPFSQPPPPPLGDPSDINRVLQPLDPAVPGAFGPPGPRPRTPISNPLPPPPRDVYDMTPYRALLNLPQTTALLTSTYGTVAPPPVPRDSGSGSGEPERRKSLKRMFSSRRKREEQQQQRQPPLNFFPVFVPQPQPPSQSSQPPASHSTSTAAAVDPSPVIPTFKFDSQSPFMNHSPHRVLYQNKTYPTALHLHEALKFITHRPDLAEQIRACADVHSVYPLSASIHEHARADWGEVFLKSMEEVLYLKFKQHPDLRNMLMDTGRAPIVYVSSEDAYWGQEDRGGAEGGGENQLGKTLVRVRERLRAEGYSSQSTR